MTTTPAPTDLDAIRKHIQLAEDWAEYGHVGDPNWHVARTLIKQVPALLDELDKTRAELDKVRAELEQATQQRNNFRDLAIRINQVRGEANPATTAEPADEPKATCGAVCPDITTITCTMPPDHPPVPVMVDGTAFPLAHFSKPYATAWNPGTALIHNATPEPAAR